MRLGEKPGSGARGRVRESVRVCTCTVGVKTLCSWSSTVQVSSVVTVSAGELGTLVSAAQPNPKVIVCLWPMQTGMVVCGLFMARRWATGKSTYMRLVINWASIINACLTLKWPRGAESTRRTGSCARRDSWRCLNHRERRMLAVITQIRSVEICSYSPRAREGIDIPAVMRQQGKGRALALCVCRQQADARAGMS